MAKNLTQNLIDLSDRSFGSYRATELTLNHRENCLHVRPLVVMRQESIPIEIIEVPHSIPESVKLMMVVCHASRIRLERNVGYTSLCLNGVEIPSVSVGFIGRDLIDVKRLGCLIYQWDELAIIRGLIRSSFYTGDYVGIDSTHKMSLNPGLLTAFLTVFMVKPSGISSGAKSRRINGEVSLYGSERTSTLLNQSFQERRQFWILKVAGIAGEGWSLSNQFFCLCVSQVRHETPTRHCSVSLISNPKYHVSQWQSWPSEPVFWLLNTIAQITEQCDKAFLLMHLSLIVSWPFLSASHFNGLGISNASIRLGLSLDNKFNSVNVLTRFLSLFKIGACAERMTVVKVYDIRTITGLGGDFPAQLILFNLTCCCYHQSSFFSRIHLNTPSLNSTTVTINNISQVTVIVNTYWQYILDKLFVMIYLTAYIYNDILLICHICHTKWRKWLRSFIAFVVAMNGILTTLIKNQQLVQVAIAHTGKNRKHGSSGIKKILDNNDKIAYSTLVFKENEEERLTNGQYIQEV